MTETLPQQEVVYTPEDLVFSRLVTESRAAATHFGGSSFGAGYSDIAESVYTVGSVRRMPFDMATVTFKAERYRDEPGELANMTDYQVSLSVAHTVMLPDVPIEVCETLMELHEGTEAYNDPPSRFQHITTIDFNYDDDGLFSAEHETHYRANEDPDLCVSIDEEGIAVPAFGYGSMWEFDADEEGDEVVGAIALQGALELSEGEKFDDSDHYNLIFNDMTDEVNIDMEDIQLARVLLKSLRKRHIPQQLRAALGFTDVYNPKPGKS